VNDVWVLPNAYFEIAPRFVYVNDQEVHFFNLSDNGDIYYGISVMEQPRVK